MLNYPQILRFMQKRDRRGCVFGDTGGNRPPKRGKEGQGPFCFINLYKDEKFRCAPIAFLAESEYTDPGKQKKIGGA